MLSYENFGSHECDMPLKNTKRIEVIYFRDDSYKGKKLMTGWGTDGVLYTFEVVPRKPIPITTPLTDDSNRRFLTDNFKRNKTDGDLTEPLINFYLRIFTKRAGLSLMCYFLVHASILSSAWNQS